MGHIQAQQDQGSCCSECIVAQTDPDWLFFVWNTILNELSHVKGVFGENADSKDPDLYCLQRYSGDIASDHELCYI